MNGLINAALTCIHTQPQEEEDTRGCVRGSHGSRLKGALLARHSRQLHEWMDAVLLQLASNWQCSAFLVDPGAPALPSSMQTCTHLR
jgi:hypothetical protein